VGFMKTRRPGGTCKERGFLSFEGGSAPEREPSVIQRGGLSGHAHYVTKIVSIGGPVAVLGMVTFSQKFRHVHTRWGCRSFQRLGANTS